MLIWRHSLVLGHACNHADRRRCRYPRGHSGFPDDGGLSGAYRAGRSAGAAHAREDGSARPDSAGLQDAGHEREAVSRDPAPHSQAGKHSSGNSVSGDARVVRRAPRGRRGTAQTRRPRGPPQCGESNLGAARSARSADAGTGVARAPIAPLRSGVRLPPSLRHSTTPSRTRPGGSGTSGSRHAPRHRDRESGSCCR